MSNGKINGKQIIDNTVVKTINGLTSSNQFLTSSSDTNVTLLIGSSGSTHSFTLGWVGLLPLNRGGLSNSTFTSSQILIVNSLTNSVISSGYYFNDLGTSNRDILSAQAIYSVISGLTGSGSSNQMAYWSGNKSLTSSSNFLFDGTVATSSNFNISASFRYTNGSQGNGYILISDANGIASWTPSSAISSDTATFSSMFATSSYIVGLTANSFKYLDGSVYATGKVLTSDNNGNVSWQYPESLSKQIYMFASASSDISPYEDAVVLSNFTQGATGSTATSVTITPTIIGQFITELGYPNINVIPSGTITLHYETKKTTGSNNYYTYTEIYKRTTGGVETLLVTSDNSTQTSVNTIVQNTVGAFLTDNTFIDVTDRIVVKIYAVMLSASATITLYYDNDTNSRLELPIVVLAGTTTYIPYNGAISNVNLGSYSLTTNTLNTTNINSFTGASAAIIDSTGYINLIQEKWTIELMLGLSASFYAPYNLTINSITNILNSPTITLYDDDVAYTLGNLISSGSRITTVGSTNSVVTLNISK